MENKLLNAIRKLLYKPAKWVLAYEVAELEWYVRNIGSMHDALKLKAYEDIEKYKRAEKARKEKTK